MAKNTVSVPLTATAQALQSLGNVKAMSIVVGDLKIDIPANEVVDAMTAMSVSADSRRKWKDAEDEISARFGAPACYEAGKPERKALTEFLGRVHPDYPALMAAESKVIEAEKLSLGIAPTKSQQDDKKAKIRMAKAYRNQIQLDMEKSIAYGISSLNDEYKDGLNPDQRGTKGDGPTVLELCVKYAASMDRKMKSEKLSVREARTATLISRICKAVISNDWESTIGKLTLALPIHELPATAQKKDTPVSAVTKVFTKTEVDQLNAQLNTAKPKKATKNIA